MRWSVALSFFVAVAVIACRPAAAQGVSSVVRPAGTSFSVTTGIGSSATVTSHPPFPGPPVTSAPPIVGLLPYVPDDKELKAQNDAGEEDREHVKPVARRRAPSPYEESNAIARQRIESPQNSAFDVNSVFREK